MSSEAQSNRYAPPEAPVSDVAFDDGTAAPAGRGIRLGAAIIDALIWGVVGIPLYWTAFSTIMAGGGPTAFAEAFWIFNPAIYATPGGMATLAGWIVLCAITIVLVHRNGQTIGKKLLGIKVVRSDGSRASLGRIFWLRNVVNAIPGMIPLVGGFYVLIDHLFIFTEKRQCLHDKIADTIVVTA